LKRSGFTSSKSVAHLRCAFFVCVFHGCL
jgi:hypothetical protein